MQEAVQMPKKHQVFLSFAHSDKADAAAISAAIERAGARVWTADLELRPGEDFLNAVERGIAECDTYVLMLTPEFLRSAWCMYELGFLLSEQKSNGAAVIPILGGDTAAKSLPTVLRKFPVIDGSRMAATEIAGEVLDQLRRSAHQMPSERVSI
jgi:hypothetical protein